MTFGKTAKRTHDYVRNGTLDMYAAIDVRTLTEAAQSLGSVVVVNTGTWGRTGLVRVFLPESRIDPDLVVEVVDPSTGDVVAGVTEAQEYARFRPRGRYLSFVARDIPPLGFAMYELRSGFDEDITSEDSFIQFLDAWWPEFTPLQALVAMAERIEIVSAERVQAELTKLLLSGNPRAGLEVLVDTGLAEHVLPELPALQLEIDEHHRHKDVYEHSLTVLEQAIEQEETRFGGPDFVSRFAALMHDVGKPKTRRFQADGSVTFHHHDVVGAKITRKRMQALRFSKEETEAVAKLVELHLRFHGYGTGEWTDSAVRRYVRDAGDQLTRLHVLTRADCTTRNKRKAQRLRRTYDDLEARIERLGEEEELAALRPDLDGNQIMEILGIPPGREVGEAYKFLLEKRLDDGPMTAAEATAVLLRWWAERSEA
jgi:putative nucleotidyltransferase with HDIG domain